MFYLLTGLALWAGAHSLKRLAPAMRRDLEKTLGQKLPRVLVALVILAALYLMITGYKRMDLIALYSPFPGAGYLNNLLMLPAIFLMGVGTAGGPMCARIRHPMLWGLVLWSLAHLLVNGDLAALLLFGGLGIWALVQMRLINQHEGPWERPKPGDAIRDLKLALGTLFIYAVIAGIHWLSGINVFQGSFS
jgi:uncharacterized membrane protein